MVDAAFNWSDLADDSLAKSDSSLNIDALLSEHFAFIWRVFRRMGLAPADADDATQQVFMIASNKLEQMVPQRERAFLYGIALRVQSHAHRSRLRRREVPEESTREPRSDAPTPDTQLALKEAWTLLDELLDKLPEKLRRVMVLAEVEGLEVSEVATLEGIPIGTAASRLRLGRERFRALLAKHSARNPWRGGS